MTCGADTVALGQNKLAMYKYQYRDNCSLKLVTLSGSYMLHQI